MKLLRHTVFNLIGLGAPLLVAVGTIPVLIHQLGPSRFGLLTLIWAVVSYFGLFDLGLGRALTQQLAVVFANKEYKKVGPLVGTATLLMTMLGVVAGVLMAAAASWGVGLIHDVPDRQEAVNAVYAMALAMPFIVLTSGFRGILEAQHAFGTINLIRLPMGLFTFLGPLAVVLYGGGPRLDYIAWVLVAGRVMACVIHAYYAWRVLPKEHGALNWQADLLKPLCISGGWMTMSNIISPFMGYIDRFIIGGILSAAAVAYYATPQELVTKLWIIPSALTAVLFPTFAVQMMQRNQQSWLLFKQAVRWLYFLLLPITVVLVLFAHEILTWWVGLAFASNSAVLLQIFSLGIFINCIAHVPFTLIQSAGMPRLTALIHAVELPFFIVVLWWLTLKYGLIGAAAAWLLRMTIDTVLMFVVSIPLMGQPIKNMFTINVLWFTLFSAFAFAGVTLESVMHRVLWATVVTSSAIALLLLSIQAKHSHNWQS